MFSGGHDRHRRVTGLRSHHRWSANPCSCSVPILNARRDDGVVCGHRRTELPECRRNQRLFRLFVMFSGTTVDGRFRFWQRLAPGTRSKVHGRRVVWARIPRTLRALSSSEPSSPSRPARPSRRRLPFPRTAPCNDFDVSFRCRTGFPALYERDHRLQHVDRSLSPVQQHQITGRHVGSSALLTATIGRASCAPWRRCRLHRSGDPAPERCTAVSPVEGWFLLVPRCGLMHSVDEPLHLAVCLTTTVFWQPPNIVPTRPER